MPSDSSGPMTMAQIFCAAVTLVTASEPRELTEVCRMIEPIAVMENCSAIGRPMDSSRLHRFSSSLHSPC